MIDILPGEAFGSWLIRHVQASTGSESIFAGDQARQRHIRAEFNEWAGRLVGWAFEYVAQPDEPEPTAGELCPRPNTP